RRRRHTRWPRDWSSDVCSSDLLPPLEVKDTKDAGDSVLVRSVLNFGGGNGVPVTWRLVKRGGGYRIFDVNVDGIWLASTQKTNFVSVLKKNNGKMSALLDYLRQ